MSDPDDFTDRVVKRYAEQTRMRGWSPQRLAKTEREMTVARHIFDAVTWVALFGLITRRKHSGRVFLLGEVGAVSLNIQVRAMRDEMDRRESVATDATAGNALGTDLVAISTVPSPQRRTALLNLRMRTINLLANRGRGLLRDSVDSIPNDAERERVIAMLAEAGIGMTPATGPR